MSPTTLPSTVHAPLQERSRRTLERILRATERLLQRHPFDEIGVQQIVRGARASVGSFYARFEDKTALLTALYQRYEEGLDGHVQDWREATGEPGPDLTGAASWVARYLIDTFRGRRNLLRALALHVRSEPSATDEATSERRAEQHAFLLDTLLVHRDRIPDEDPERAVRTAIFLAASSCRERVLFADAPHARAVPQSDEQLTADLTRLIVGYLLCPELSGEIR